MGKKDDQEYRDKVEYFLDLIQPFITAHEQYWDVITEERAELCRAFRRIRPLSKGTKLKRRT